MWSMQSLVCKNIELAMLEVLLMKFTGFSFTGEVRDPFGPVIEALAKSKVPVTSVDAPSSWNIESGPPASGPGKYFNPATLVSLTAPKPLTKWFKGRHFLGGR
jgi:NAD(P)H-hydrate epimerase